MINNDPVRTSATDRWRVTLAEEAPQGAWRDKFLAKAESTPAGRTLELSVEGRTVVFSCPDSDNSETLKSALHSRMRLIAELLKETKPA